jgi:multidrug efflux pump subunit AcrA (membrane-fusion protein)
LSALALSACTSAPPAAKVDPLISVRLGQVQAADNAQFVRGAGTFALRLETPLGFTSPGRIARILVQEGDVVRRGQLLAVLDTTSVEADLSAASAELVRAEAELKRSSTLLKDGWVTQPRVDSARASAEAARALRVTPHVFLRRAAALFLRVRLSLHKLLMRVHPLLCSGMQAVVLFCAWR